MAQNVIPIFFTADERYAPWLDCAVRSMVENASADYSYQIIVLHQDLTEESRKKIASGVRAPFSIRFVSMEVETPARDASAAVSVPLRSANIPSKGRDATRRGLNGRPLDVQRHAANERNAAHLDSAESLAGIVDREENRLRCDYFTLTIYYRLFIADRFPEYDKGIYLDSDIVVPGDISELYQIELGENLIGACTDRSIVSVPELVDYVENAVGTPIDRYINSGILLMNLKKMRQTDFCGHFLRLLHTFHFDCIAPDQDYINAMCSGKIVYLDETWDAMPPEGGAGVLELEKPNLIHYNLFQKPWCYDNIPYEEYFWYYAKKSPFYPDIVQFKENYSDEQKESDRTCLRNLIQKGARLARENKTFRKAFENGGKIRVC
ncbi:MAG: glycosyltransferase family 8 protein [Clostridiales bacterium]|nr:glycosyltransferase family 8 protein [Clostridiales bacterium]